MTPSRHWTSSTPTRSARDCCSTNSPSSRTSERPHILVAHLEAGGARLIFHAARQWYDTAATTTVPLLVTVVDDHAEQQVDALLGQYPVLENEKVCEFVTCSASVRGIRRRLADQQRQRFPAPT